MLENDEDPGLSPGRLAQAVREARERTFALVADLTDEQLIGPRLAIVNPLLWEIGHLAWFQEFWTLRGGGRLPSLRKDADALYDSSAIPHDTRWDLPLPSRAETLAYLRDVRARVLARIEALPPPAPPSAGRQAPRRPAAHGDLLYFIALTVLHEDMHDEAFLYTRQTLGYPAPRLPGQGGHPGGGARALPRDGAGPRSGKEESAAGASTRDMSSPRSRAERPGRDALLPGGTFMLGASPDEPFVFDNEKWAHPVELAPFAIATTAVTQEGFARFVDDGGYRRRELWSEPGWAWREAAGAEHPVYWRRGARSVRASAGVREGWRRRAFDRWVPLEPAKPVIHVNWYEAEAYCRWAGRRLPTEAEWEMAAAWDPAAGRKRRFPWGDEGPSPARANLDARELGCLDAAALPAGDSAAGCRQMIGNVWEWTASDFAPYPGFVRDPYKEYSEPWFFTHKVLRGGCWATRARLIRNTWRNFYEPQRRDVWSGFRTCAP